MGNLIEHAKKEFLIAGYKTIEECDEESPEKWIQEGTLDLLEVFASQGHSGSSAPHAIAIFKTLASFGLLSPITGNDSEWNDIAGISGNTEMFQNNRCSAIFKDGKDGKPYYLNAIAFRDENGDSWSGSGDCWSGSGALLESGERIGCPHYIKLPFTEKTFYVYVRSVEVHKDDWEMYIIDPKQLDEVFQYYEKKIRE